MQGDPACEADTLGAAPASSFLLTHVLETAGVTQAAGALLPKQRTETGSVFETNNKIIFIKFFIKSRREKSYYSRGGPSGPKD